MKTKKFFFAIAALLCMMAVTVTTSCSKDDDSSSSTPTITGAEFTYYVSLTENGYDLCDKSVTYIDENGSEKTEAFTGSTWKKTITVKKFPFSASLKTTPTRNATAATDDAYKFKTEYFIQNITSVSSDGSRQKLTGETELDTPSFSQTMPMAADKVDDYIKRLAERPALTVTLKVDGSKMEIVR